MSSHVDKAARSLGETNAIIENRSLQHDRMILANGYRIIRMSN